MQRLIRIMRWRAKLPVTMRWLAALVLFGLALAVRMSLGTLYGANPALSFYPAILVAAALLGWQQAVLVLVLCVISGIVLFLPPGMYLMPIGWLLIGGMNIAVIAALQALADDLAEANERHRILFQELQHRVANTLQAVVGTLELSRIRLGSAPNEAARMLEDAAHRIAASADVHRRLQDPTLFQRGLGSILRDAVASVIDHRAVHVTFDLQEPALTFGQMSTLTMVVIEAANNAQKHVFQRQHGSRFTVALRALPNRRARLTIKDDGPGLTQGPGGAAPDQRMGMGVLQALVDQIHGTLHIAIDGGTEITVVFPLAGKAA